MDEQRLNPAQQDVVDQLGAAATGRPEFEPELRQQIRLSLEAALAPVIPRLPADDVLWINKHALESVHGCQARYLAERDQPFEVSVPIARGAVAHKAIELSVNWRGDPSPADLVDRALDTLENTEHWLADFLQSCGDTARAELRSEAVERVTKFEECWPRLLPRWRPVTESRLRIDLFESRVVLQGKVDLTLGKADGARAGKVVVDFKTGGFSPAHRDHLRFYALLETLRIGVPPRRLASYYLDSGNFVPEDVTHDLLEATVARVADGITELVELRLVPELARRRPGPPCTWCRIQEDCAEGTAWLAAETDIELAV